MQKQLGNVSDRLLLQRGGNHDSPRPKEKKRKGNKPGDLYISIAILSKTPFAGITKFPYGISVLQPFLLLGYTKKRKGIVSKYP